jgi:hypothetical protein
MGLRDRLTTLVNPSRSAVIPPWLPGYDNFSPYAFLANGQTYPLDGLSLTMPGSREEEIESNFESYVQRAYKGNSVVFSLMRDRVALFSQARFRYRSLVNDKLFGDPSLDILLHPGGPNTTTGDLLSRALTDADIAGNFYATRRRTRTSDRIKRMRPSWVTMVFGTDDPDVSADDLEAEFLGIIYYPGGEYHPTGKPEYLQRSEIAHFAPIPDPTAHVRGMSWITPIVREIMGDSAATAHKLKFFENGATPNMVVSRKDAPDKNSFREWRQIIEEGHTGIANAYRTLYLTNGAEATVVGKDLQQLDFKVVQGAGESRLAAAAGIHPTIAGLSEGLQGSSLNSGNFGAARRLVADKTLWWLWGNFCGSMETLVPPPAKAQLWVDGKIPFLREDRKDAAEIQQVIGATIGQYVRDGFTPESATAATLAEDPTLLKHSGLYSVQLQPAGTTPVAATKPSNGTKPPQEAPA